VGAWDQNRGGGVEAYRLVVRACRKPCPTLSEDPLDREASYNAQGVIAIKQEAARALSQELLVPESWAELLLEYYSWKPKTAIRAWRADEEACCAAAGLPHNKLYRARQVARDGQNFGLRQPTVVSQDGDEACAICYAVLLFFLWSMRAKMANGHVAHPLHLSFAAVGVVHAGTAAFAQAVHSLRHDRLLVVLAIALGAGAGAIALGYDNARARVPVDDSDDEDDHLRADNAEGALLRKRRGILGFTQDRAGSSA